MTPDQIRAALPDELMEYAIGLAAQAVYRQMEQKGPQEAADMAEAATSTLRSIWFDFMRQANKKGTPQ